MDSIAGSARAIYRRRGWWMVAAVLLLAFACGGSSRGQGLGGPDQEPVDLVGEQVREPPAVVALLGR